MINWICFAMSANATSAPRLPRTPSVWLTGIILIIAHHSASAVETLNDNVSAVIEDFKSTRSNGGYDINSAYTKNLEFGQKCCIKASAPPLTMCVAAVSEVIIEALNLLNDQRAFDSLPADTWSKGNIGSLRANIFMYKGTGTRGTGHALSKFGIGREKKFNELKPYDFVNFNRTDKSGHAAVFISFLDSEGRRTPVYAPSNIGFAYYSAQGKGKPDAGLAERNAYFNGHCPAAPIEGIKRDCGVIRSSNLALLNGGELWHPKEWRVEEARAAMAASVRSTLSQRFPNGSREFIDENLNAVMSRELSPQSKLFEGVTTD